MLAILLITTNVVLTALKNWDVLFGANPKKQTDDLSYVSPRAYAVKQRTVTSISRRIHHRQRLRHTGSIEPDVKQGVSRGLSWVRRLPVFGAILAGFYALVRLVASVFQ